MVAGRSLCLHFDNFFLFEKKTCLGFFSIQNKEKELTRSDQDESESKIEAKC